MIQKEDVKQLLNNLQQPVLSLYLRVDAGYIENQADKPCLGDSPQKLHA